MSSTPKPTPSPPTPDRPPADAYRRWASETPDRIAVDDGELRLSYAELAATAHSLALRMDRLCGAGAQRVAVLTSSRVRGLLAMLAALDCGKVFVPLDPGSPGARLDAILADLEPALILADAWRIAALTCDVARRTPVLDAATIELASVTDRGATGRDEARTLEPPDDDALAWILFTSGSTGRAKGVLQTRGNAGRYAWELAGGELQRSGDSVGVSAPLNVHAGVVYSLAALRAGATLHHLDVLEAGISGYLERVHAAQLDVLFIPPALLRRLRAHRLPDSLRMVRLYGETATRGDLAIHRATTHPSCVLTVGLGATEAGTFTSARFDPDSRPTGAALPVGEAVEGKHVVVLDDRGHPAPPGEPGAVVVASRHLSPGYWRQPELDAANYAEDPDDPLTRVFRTGDLGFFADDGALCHLGRVDDVVKIRGHRVDLTEVLGALLEIDTIANATVTVGRTSNDEAVLTAHVVLVDRTRPSVTALREQLAQSLPGFMIPARFAVLDELPLTSSGKIDRQALPSAAPSRDGLATTMVAPRDEHERTLARIWRAVLGVDVIGVHDRFVDLGGDSLAAMEVLSRVEEAFDGAHVDAALLAAPTIASQAALLEGETAHGAPALVRLGGTGSAPPLFLVPPSGKTTLSMLPLVERLPPGTPVYGIEYRGIDGRTRADDDLGAMAERCVQAMRAVQRRGPYHLAGRCFGGVVAYETACRLVDAGESVELLAIIDTLRPPGLRPPALGAKLAGHARALVSDPPRHTRRLARKLAHRAKRKFAGVMMEAMLSAHRRARFGHVPSQFPGSILLMLNSEDLARAHDWAPLARDGLELREVPGNHLNVYEARQIDVVAEALTEALEPATSPS